MSHINSKSFELDGRETLIPTVHKGKQLSDEEAIKRVREGKAKPLGVFKSREVATRAGKQISMGKEEARAKGLRPMNPSGSRLPQTRATRGDVAGRVKGRRKQ